MQNDTNLMKRANQAIVKLVMAMYVAGVVFMSLFFAISYHKDYFTANSSVFVVGVLSLTTSTLMALRLYKRAAISCDKCMDLCVRDCVTRLYSLSYVIDQGQKKLEAAKHITVLVLDLDNFSQINDTYGHLVGNRLLYQFGQLLLKQTEEFNGIVGRIGADEFVILLEDYLLYNKRYLSTMIYERLQNYEFNADTELESIKLSCSIGAADSIEDTAKEVQELITIADKKMHYYKYQYYKEVVNFQQLYPAELTIESSQLLAALAQKDMYTFVHSKYTAQYAERIARELGLQEDVLQQIVMAAWIHDIGKLVIPDDILRKKDKLTEYEYGIVKKHVNYGISLLTGQSLTKTCTNAILYHHERWDGKGYPSGLCGEETPLEGRIMQIADSFSAMKIKRVYRNRFSTQDALAELNKNKGKQYDENIVDIFTRVMSEEL